MFQYISCYSLSNRCFKDCPKTQVSIHLMLLFIYCRTSLLGNIKSFQYISCYSLSEQGERTASVRCRFNTSHVTLYLLSALLIVQILLRFNTSHVTLYQDMDNAGMEKDLLSFNTSHVTLYHFSYRKLPFHPKVSIHLMLLFISNSDNSTGIGTGVSIHLMLLFIEETRHNGQRYSGVSIHLMLLFIWIKPTHPGRGRNVSIHLMLLFIKKLYEVRNRSGDRFNTSHVTLYPSAIIPSASFTGFQYISCYSLSAERQNGHIIHASFNTSHVTLYQVLTEIFSCKGLVSIHLMLLFICDRLLGNGKGKKVSIHLMLLFIGKSCVKWHSGSCVSIHLMLLFIPRFIGFSSSNSFYNTAKYKGLQDFYQPTYHFLFTHQNLI